MSFKIRVSYSECISPSFSIFVIRSFFPLWAISIQGPSLVSKVALYISPICSSIIKSISNGAEKKTLYFSSHAIQVCIAVIADTFQPAIPSNSASVRIPLSVVLSSTFLSYPFAMSCLSTYWIRPQPPPSRSRSKSSNVIYGISKSFSNLQKWLTCRPPSGTIDIPLTSVFPCMASQYFGRIISSLSPSPRITSFAKYSSG